MLDKESSLDFVRQATAELVVSFNSPRDHNLHAAFNGLIAAIEADRARISALEMEVARLNEREGTAAGRAQ